MDAIFDSIVRVSRQNDIGGTAYQVTRDRGARA